MKLLFLLLLLLTPEIVRADGGVVRARETQGSLTVTVFTAASVTKSMPADISVLVQQKAAGAVVLDAAVDLTFEPPTGSSLPAESGWCGPMRDTFLLGAPTGGGSPPVPATRARATNQLLYAAQVILPAEGAWHLRATVRRGPEMVILPCDLPVGAAVAPLAIIWPWLLLPPAAIAIFLLHQNLRRRSNRPAIATR
jgi:hypothetical protein